MNLGKYYSIIEFFCRKQQRIHKTNRFGFLTQTKRNAKKGRKTQKAETFLSKRRKIMAKEAFSHFFTYFAVCILNYERNVSAYHLLFFLFSLRFQAFFKDLKKHGEKYPRVSTYSKYLRTTLLRDGTSEPVYRRKNPSGYPYVRFLRQDNRNHPKPYGYPHP